MLLLNKIWTRVSSFFSFLGNAVRILASLATLLLFLGIGSAVAGLVGHHMPVLLLGISIFVPSMVIFFFLSTVAKELQATRGTAPQPPPPMPNTGGDVALSLKEVVYQYRPDGRPMCQRKRFQVRALRSGVTIFSDRYRWTGTGACSLRSLTAGFAIRNQRKEEFWDYFDVQFPHPLQQNQQVDFTVEWTLIDEAGTAVPFLSTMIDVDTERLVLRVQLPPELAPKRALCYEFANYLDTSGDLPVSMQEVPWNPATQSIVYEVDKPKRYYKYLIRWFND